MNVAIKSITEQRDFIVSSSSLKEVRSFSREVFEKVNINQDLKDELVLAIAEAAQNIVKHAYKDNPSSNDIMVVEVSCVDNKLKIVVEMGGSRKLEWKPLSDYILAEFES